MEVAKPKISPESALDSPTKPASSSARGGDLPSSITKRSPEGISATAEGQLLLRHLEGEPGAFAELVEIYRAPVYSYLVRCGVPTNDRDDLFQDIFIKIHRAASSYDSGRPLHPWLFTIVCNTVRNHLRRQRVRQLVFREQEEEERPPEPPDPMADGERRAVARQTVQVLQQEIQHLPLAQREVVVLAAVEKKPLKEVALILGLKINTVKTHLRRGRLALAQALVRRHHPQEEGI